MSRTVPPGAAEFFATARERQAIYLRRQAGRPWPWTDDPVMRQYSITNVFRENDKTTKWFRTNVREKLRDRPEVLLATVLFRWFNRISTGTAVFKQQSDYGYGISTAWDVYRECGDTMELKQAILNYCGKGPYVTGSYIILGQQGMPKLDGVLACLDAFYKNDYEWPDASKEDRWLEDITARCNWREVGYFLLQQRGNVRLETVWQWLRKVPYLGDFMAYEIVTDLRWTGLLDRAPDINTWANPGPGAARGLARVFGRDISGRKIKKPPKVQMIAEMRQVLALSRSPEYWPQMTRGCGIVKTRGYEIEKKLHTPLLGDSWPAWELHEVEMWLCEFDKIMRVRTGEGRPRGTYRPSS